MRSLTDWLNEIHSHNHKPWLHRTYSHVTLSFTHSTAYIKYKDRALLCGAYADTFSHTNTTQIISRTPSTWMSPQLLHPSPITGHKVQGTGVSVCNNSRPVQVAGDTPGNLYWVGWKTREWQWPHTVSNVLSNLLCL